MIHESFANNIRGRFLQDWGEKRSNNEASAWKMTNRSFVQLQRVSNTSLIPVKYPSIGKWAFYVQICKFHYASSIVRVENNASEQSRNLNSFATQKEVMNLCNVGVFHYILLISWRQCIYSVVRQLSYLKHIWQNIFCTTILTIHPITVVIHHQTDSTHYRDCFC
jgi:hypothetical protein